MEVGGEAEEQGGGGGELRQLRDGEELPELDQRVQAAPHVGHLVLEQAPAEGEAPPEHLGRWRRRWWKRLCKRRSRTCSTASGPSARKGAQTRAKVARTVAAMEVSIVALPSSVGLRREEPRRRAKKGREW